MLVLTRKAGERIRIGKGVVVTVLNVDRNTVMLGVTAPADVTVDREEVALRKERIEKNDK